MKRSIVALGPVAVLTAALAVGCGSKMPSNELVDARQAYARAQQGPAAQVNPAGLYDAKQALARAERAQEEDANSAEAQNLAYIAHRKTLQAEAQGRAIIAQRQQMQAEQTLQQMRQQQLAQAREQLEQFQEKRQMTEQELAAERRARAQAEKQAKDALDRLSAFVVVQEQPGQMVLTLNGQVLFEFGESSLMPTARQRLQGVSDALKMMEGRKLTIVGHTDNVGDAQANQELSLERAKSVRDYLVQQGLPQDMMTVEGRGESQPIAPNTTPAGRANNRRVEIIVGDGEGMQGMQGTMGGQTGQQPKAKTGGSEQKQKTKQGQQQKTKQQTPKQGQQQPGTRGQQGQEPGTAGDR